MASTHYFICRTSPFLVLGPEKWLSHKELAEGKCPIYVFPDSKTAQTVQSSLPSTVKLDLSCKNPTTNFRLDIFG